MPSDTPLPLVATLPIDPVSYGVSASPQALNLLVNDLYRHISAQVIDDITRQVTAKVAQEVAEKVTREVTEYVTREVTEQVTEHVTAQVTEKVTLEVTEKVTAELRKEHQAEIIAFFEQLKAERRRYFGPSADTAQGRLFDEADMLAATTTEADDRALLPPVDTTAPEAASGSKKTSPPKARGKRGPLSLDLPRIDVIHDVPEAERVCPCGTPMVQIGEEVSEQLDIVPMQVRVLRHIRKRYACPSKDTAPVIAPVPAQVLPRSNASSALLAMLLVTKYVDGLPLYRFESILARSGVVVPRQTLARWVIGTAQALQPLHNLLRDHALDSPIVHIDETTVQVLNEDGREATSKSYMWVQVAGPPERPVVLYDYDPSRAQRVPNALLEGWQGHLMTDGYRAYNGLGRKQGITLLACWAHVRRKYIDAQRLKQGKPGHADVAIDLIRRLYKVEKEQRHASDAERLQARQEISRPLLEQLRQFHEKVAPTVLPSSPLGKALAYQNALWPRLVRYVERGDLPIDNNSAEGKIRPFVVGRKAWLFSQSTQGAHASAVIYSLVETAKANGLEPYTWLCRALRELPHAKTVDDYEALLPWNQLPIEVLSNELAQMNR
jgi:transposase